MSQTNDYYVPVSTNDPAYKLLARYRQDYQVEKDGEGRVDVLSVLASIVTARHGIQPACGRAARQLARRYIQYSRVLKRLKVMAKKQLDHPYLAAQAEDEIRLATAIVATIGYYCNDRLRILDDKLDAEIFDAMMRAKIFIENVCSKYTGIAYERCVYSRASILAAGAERPDLVEDYLRRLGLVKTMTVSQA